MIAPQPSLSVLSVAQVTPFFTPTPTILPFRRIARIMDRFDFARVHQCMTAMNWGWYVQATKETPCHVTVPDEPTLRETARHLLEVVVKPADKSKPQYLSTGGFVARTDEDGILSLEFVVAQCMVDTNGHVEL